MRRCQWWRPRRRLRRVNACRTGSSVAVPNFRSDGGGNEELFGRAEVHVAPDGGARELFRPGGGGNGEMLGRAYVRIVYDGGALELVRVGVVDGAEVRLVVAVAKILERGVGASRARVGGDRALSGSGVGYLLQLHGGDVGLSLERK